jgi:hypothetical protein
MTGQAPSNPKRVTFRTEYAQLLGPLQVSFIADHPLLYYSSTRLPI